jgi:hypothetical protein
MNPCDIYVNTLEEGAYDARMHHRPPCLLHLVDGYLPFPFGTMRFICAVWCHRDESSAGSRDPNATMESSSLAIPSCGVVGILMTQIPLLPEYGEKRCSQVQPTLNASFPHRTIRSYVEWFLFGNRSNHLHLDRPFRMEVFDVCCGTCCKVLQAPLVYQCIMAPSSQNQKAPFRGPLDIFNFPYIFISMSTPAGREIFINESIVFAFGSRISISLL